MINVFDVYFSPNSYYSHCLLMQDFGIAYKIWSQSNISKIPIKLTAIRCILKLLLHNLHQFVLNNWPITLFTRKDDSREQMKYMYDAAWTYILSDKHHDSFQWKICIYTSIKLGLQGPYFQGVSSLLQTMSTVDSQIQIQSHSCQKHNQ